MLLDKYICKKWPFRKLCTDDTKFIFLSPALSHKVISLPPELTEREFLEGRQIDLLYEQKPMCVVDPSIQLISLFLLTSTNNKVLTLKF